MRLCTRRGGVAARIVSSVLIGLAIAVPAFRAAAQGVPDRISDQEYWRMITTMSESPGFFQSDNLTSNETGFQYVIPELQRTIKPGGVYMGVGPEQNFTYIVALQPKIVFIVDIRRDAMLQHLMYKTLFELYDNRADFLSHLFSRPRPKGLDSTTGVNAMFAAYDAAPVDSMLWYRTYAAMKDHLIRDHGFALAPADTLRLVAIFDAFYRGGPEVNYSYCAGDCRSSQGGGRGGNGFGSMATLYALMTASDGAGLQRSFLASEKNYRAIRDLEMKNLLVPVTGDFAGAKAIRAVGEWVKGHNATVTTVYTSNVEQYLFQNGVWSYYYENMKTVPFDSTSQFIRSGGGRAGNCGGGYGGGGRGPGGMGGSVIGSVLELLNAFTDGKIQCYGDIFAYTH